MATVYGSKVNNVWRAYMTYTVTTTPTQVKVSITSGLNIPNDGYNSHRSFTATISGTSQTTVSGSISNKKYVGVLTKAIKSATYTWNRASTKQTKTIKTVLKGYGESTTSSCSASISVPALAPATITFDANGGSGTVPSAISTYVGVANTIPSNSHHALDNELHRRRNLYRRPDCQQIRLDNALQQSQSLHACAELHANALSMVSQWRTHRRCHR